MTLYGLCVGLHLLAATLWLGHMFVWSLIVGPAMKGIQPPETAAMLRETSLSMGGLGWPALIVLTLSGAYMLSWRGITIADLLSGAAFAGPAGAALAVKLVLVLGMIGYQVMFAHRRAPRAIYANMLAALGILAASVVIVRPWS
jgi:uncharacterized membrane protein